jgi:creatinine amidohydrolase
VYISPQAFKKYVREVCLALKYYGVKKIVIVNGHGGNLNALSELARELREQGVFVSVFQWWHASPKLLPEMFSPEERQHAPAEETSVNMVLYPYLVDMRKAVDEVPRKHPMQGEGIMIPLDTVDFSSYGVLGESTTAWAEKGRKVLKAVVDELAKHVTLLRKAEINDLIQGPKA